MAINAMSYVSLLCPALNGILQTLYKVQFLVGGVGHI